MLALVLLAALAVGCGATATTQTRARRGDSATVNVAGRQRTLSQQVALPATELAQPEPGRPRGQVRRELKAAIRLMASSRRALVKGGGARNLPVQRSRAVRGVYSGRARLDARVRSFLRRARAVAASDPRPGDPRIAALRRSAADLVRDLDFVVRLQTAQSARDADRVGRLQLLALGVTLLGIALTGLLVLRPTLRPRAGRSPTCACCSRSRRRPTRPRASARRSSAPCAWSVS